MLRVASAGSGIAFGRFQLAAIHLDLPWVASNDRARKRSLDTLDRRFDCPCFGAYLGAIRRSCFCGQDVRNRQCALEHRGPQRHAVHGAVDRGRVLLIRAPVGTQTDQGTSDGTSC